MNLADLSWTSLILLLVGAIGIGFSKSGFAGVGMIHVIIFATIFDTRSSTGILLPLLVVGDVLSVKLFGAQVQWAYFRRLLPPAFIGVVVGWWLLRVLSAATCRPLVACIILLLVVMQSVRTWQPKYFEHVPHARWFAIALGLMAGITSMLANAAGPVIALYLLAVSLPKYQLIGTSAWLFLVLNIFKLPFSAGLGLINWQSLTLNACLAPGVALGTLGGRWLVKRIPQKTFDTILLVITALAALRLLLA